MAKKTYRTYFLRGYHLLLTAEDGSRVEVKFRGGIQVDSTAKFTTSDEGLQALLENSTGFGRDYYIESVVDTEVPAEKAEPEKAEEEKAAPEKEIVSGMKDSRRFKNLVEMKNAMAEVGIQLDDDANYAKAKAAAAKAGYDFQIKK